MRAVFRLVSSIETMLLFGPAKLVGRLLLACLTVALICHRLLNAGFYGLLFSSKRAPSRAVIRREKTFSAST